MWLTTSDYFLFCRHFFKCQGRWAGKRGLYLGFQALLGLSLNSLNILQVSKPCWSGHSFSVYLQGPGDIQFPTDVTCKTWGCDQCQEQTTSTAVGCAAARAWPAQPTARGTGGARACITPASGGNSTIHVPGRLSSRGAGDWDAWMMEACALCI